MLRNTTTCLLRLVVRTVGFHPTNSSSILLGDDIYSGWVERFKYSRLITYEISGSTPLSAIILVCWENWFNPLACHARDSEFEPRTDR